MRLTNTYCSYAYGYSKFQIYNVLFCFPSAKDLSYYPPSFAHRSDLSNITCWYLKLLHDISKTYLWQCSMYLTVFEEFQGSTSIFGIANHFYSTMSFWFVLCSYGLAKIYFNMRPTRRTIILRVGRLEIKGLVMFRD